jgi:hypothetical protein
MTEFTQTLRHYCRNPRCRSKLPSPASDPRKAFCTAGCHSSFYLKRCIVCENDKPAGSTARRKLCRRPKCEGRYRKNSALRRPGAVMQPTIGDASAKRVLGPSAGHPLRRKCNRIGRRARQAFWSQTISASPIFLNAAVSESAAVEAITAAST